ncbi:MAG: hypothetical protein JSV04_10890 [Candidatus Heimdallarchaeota archaeon]|nr:MAG: hypothetical protein JSV04_10890 [Candidatus Heimdallarchaeota archaeon]
MSCREREQKENYKRTKFELVEKIELKKRVPHNSEDYISLKEDKERKLNLYLKEAQKMVIKWDKKTETE